MSIECGSPTPFPLMEPQGCPEMTVGSDLFPTLIPQNTVDKLIKKTNLALVIGTHSWREQFLEAITVSAGKWGGRREEERKRREREGETERDTQREMNGKTERGKEG